MSLQPPLSLDETLRVLRELSAMSGRIILVGGQAVAVWMHVLGDIYEDVSDRYATTSADIDFLGGKDEVHECARRLKGTPKVTAAKMQITAGSVYFFDKAGIQREIDFIWKPAGLTEREVVESAQVVQLDTPEGKLPVRIIHPERLLESKIINVESLGRHDELAVQQVRAMIVATHYFSRLLLDSGEGTERDVRRINERVFRFCREHRIPGDAYGLDPFAAILTEHHALPEKYYRQRDHMRKKIEEVRQRSFGRAFVSAGLEVPFGRHWVMPYRRQNGVRVSGYWRRRS